MSEVPLYLFLMSEVSLYLFLMSEVSPYLFFMSEVPLYHACSAQRASFARNVLAQTGGGGCWRGGDPAGVAGVGYRGTSLKNAPHKDPTVGLCL